MAASQSETGWRGSPDVWLTAGYESLLEGGIDAVKIMILAQRLNLSRASFYWFFKDREELLEGLLSMWREKNTGNLIKRSNAFADNLVEAILNVCDCWFDNNLFDSKFEFAVRSWALQSDAVLREVRHSDNARITAITDMFARFGHNMASADVRARTFYLLQIGYISMQTVEEMDVRLKRVPEYVRVFTGSEPEQKELDRFLSRHSAAV